MTNRLVDIEVEEVSLVDRAANKHRFLIVKRSEDMGADIEGDINDETDAPDDPEVPTEDSTPTHTAGSESVDEPNPLEQVLGALKDLATRLGTVLSKAAEVAAAPVIPAAPAPPPTPAPLPSPPAPAVTPPNRDVADALSALTKSVEQLGGVLQTQGQRLNHLEKRTGLPASSPAGEPAPRQAPKGVSWPLDLNRPRGRDDVNKDLSFHD